ncbi:hypothetical protein MasN3_33020 [Massilia varians]|uniref:Uncharacterized protein n=1 Tax=Massilia varians TaxID=457921 RepID=A0ABN6TGW5_9BURK|nr:hypothetical protein [Massilia varians]BDT59808.1 hypothetical protein MasN3_33020 [Massilia varians]
MTDIEHKPAPGRKPGIEERIAAAGQRIAALQRRLDDALADLAQARRRAAAELAQAERCGRQDPAGGLLALGDAAPLRESVELAQRQLAKAVARATPHDGIQGGHCA